MEARLLSVVHQPWPVPGCGCRTCRTSSSHDLAGDDLAGDPADDDPQLPGVALRLGAITLLPQGWRDPDGGAHRPSAGATAEPDGMRLLALADSVIVAGAQGRTLLWAVGANPLAGGVLDALTEARLDAAVLGLTGSTVDGPQRAQAQAQALAHQLAQLRRVGALADGAIVVAAGFDHHTPPERVRCWLTEWGVLTGRPGLDLLAAQPDPDGPTPPWRTLVLGPAASGKSAHAERLLAAEPEVDYAATGADPGPDPETVGGRDAVVDADWAARVARHRQRRPAWWRTREVGDSGAALPELLATPGPPVLLDSWGSWTAAALQRCGAWNDDVEPGDWHELWQQEVAAVAQAWRHSARRVVAVAEETGWGVVPATASGRIFRQAQGELVQALAAESERVQLVVAGRAVQWECGR